MNYVSFGRAEGYQKMRQSRTRKAIPLSVREIVEKKADNRCEKCSRTLITRTPSLNKPKQELEVQVWKNFPCYTCSHLNEILSLMDEVEYGVPWLDRDDLGRQLSKHYKFFRKGYSATVGASYYANHCVSCGRLQGDWFVRDWIVDQSDEQNLVERKQIPYSGKRLGPTADEFYDEFAVPHDIHHKDGNPSNNAPENLVVLCLECHRLVHSFKLKSRESEK